MADGRGNVIRRKLGVAQADAAARLADGRPGADQSWRVGLARAARDRVKLALDVSELSLDRMSLAEVLELAPERGLIAVLEGPSGGLGVIMLSPDVLAGMIEAQTTGVVTAQAAPLRRPSRTDAAMAAGLIDGALEELERGVVGVEDSLWAKGYRYASFLEDIRPLGLLLEDIPYRLFRAKVSLALGAKKGSIFMALPAEPHGIRDAKPDTLRVAAEAMIFASGLMAQIMLADCQLDGVLSRVSMSLSDIMNFEIGQFVALPGAALERISLEGLDGRKLQEGRLGQNRGLRAIRLSEAPVYEEGLDAQRQAGAPKAASDLGYAQPMLATGTG